MTGYLLHVYHLESKDWEHLVWGDASRDELGTGTKLFECLLMTPATEPVTCIIYSGPSHKDDLSEGAYTKKFLLDRMDQIAAFPRFQKKLAQLSTQDYQVFRKRVEAIIVGEELANTLEEVQHAALYFSQQGVNQVIHIAAASHAPRCIQVQTMVRRQGLVPLEQQWFTVASDVCFDGTVPSDVVVVEPSHRGDDPLLDFEPQLSKILKPYFALPVEQKKAVIRAVGLAMKAAEKHRHKNSTPNNRQKFDSGISHGIIK